MRIRFLSLMSVLLFGQVASAQFVTTRRTPPTQGVILPPLTPPPQNRPSNPTPQAPAQPEPQIELTDEERTFPRQPNVRVGAVSGVGAPAPPLESWGATHRALGSCFDRARGAVSGFEATLVVRLAVLPGGAIESATTVGNPSVSRRIGYREVSATAVPESLVDELVDCAVDAVRLAEIRSTRRAIYTVPVILGTRPMNAEERGRVEAERARVDAIRAQEAQREIARNNAEQARQEASAARSRAQEARANAEQARIEASERAVPMVCRDSCAYAGDGECDDGGPGAIHDLCRYGTDCSDCGERPVRSRRRGR
jgi:hypothetical protein